MAPRGLIAALLTLVVSAAGTGEGGPEGPGPVSLAVIHGAAPGGCSGETR